MTVDSYYFVLLHGAFHAGWVWEAVAERLERCGHRVLAPDLPGAEISDADAHRVSLSDQIEAVVTLVGQADFRDITLVGHSMSGMVATGVADRLRDRIRHLVYLDALVPKSGQSVRDLVPAEMYARAIQAIDKIGGKPLLPVIFPSEKFVDYTGEAAAAFMRRLTPQPLFTIVEPLFLRQPPVPQRTFIYCSGTPFGAFEDFARDARESAAWRYFDVSTPHDAMIVAPDEIAGILIDVVDDRDASMNAS